jgi:hypothetical protein
MIDIPKTFRMNGYDYELIRYDNGIAMYSQTLQEADFRGLCGYEVHLVSLMVKRLSQSKKSRPIASNSEFGSKAWSFVKKENADKKFKELVEREQ